MCAAALLAALFTAAPTASLAALGDCSQPVTSGASPSASDCLFILRTATGAQTCEPACICDPNGDGGTSASDALLCLKIAVGQIGCTEVCGDCGCPTATTTLPVATTTVPATTTTVPAPGVVLRGALSKTTGRFNFNLQIGLSGADAECAVEFAGTHACTFADLLEAEAAGDLDGLEDNHAKPVASFWAIDSAHANGVQCHQDLPWDYQTAHTGVKGEIATLDNASGDLGAATAELCSHQHWIGCCL
jgi:hypothetical protein